MKLLNAVCWRGVREVYRRKGSTRMININYNGNKKCNQAFAFASQRFINNVPVECINKPEELKTLAASVSNEVLKLVEQYTDAFPEHEYNSIKLSSNSGTSVYNSSITRPSPIARHNGKDNAPHHSNITSSSGSKKKKEVAERSKHIFCNNAIDMDKMSVIGFDYDYTLCSYKFELQRLIYEEAKKYLLTKAAYPKELNECIFDKNFATRGLIFDRKTGFLLKLSVSHHISPRRAFLGRRRVSPEELLQVYGGTFHVSSQYVKKNMVWMNDLFSLSEACLLADVIQLALDAGIPFEPFALHQDVNTAIGYVHKSGVMHNTVASNPEIFLHENIALQPLLEQFRASGKQVFLLTNSSFSFVNAGLTFLVNKKWRSLFDVIITDARKPTFYTSNTPFRSLDDGDSFVKWNAVTSSDLKKGRILVGGSMSELSRLAEWDTHSTNVLYFGDHLENDLVEPRRNLGWHTGAIIRELEDEINIIDSAQFKYVKKRTDAIGVLKCNVQLLGCKVMDATAENNIDTNIIEEDSDSSSSSSSSITSSSTTSSSSIPTPTPPTTESLEALDSLLDLLENEHSALLKDRGNLFNPNFGSIFRTRGDPSAYSFALYRNVDIYMTRLENLILYPTNYRFYPIKTDHLPHENSNTPLI